VQKKIIMVGLLGLLAAPACVADDGTPDGTDELAGESDADGEAGKADGGGDWTYYTIRPDMRRCVWPLCGGYFVERVNRSYTYCRGEWVQDGCYVASVDWSRTGLDADQIDGALAGKVLLRGWTADSQTDGFGNYGVFDATEVWAANSDVEDEGVYTRITDSGIRCITFPCYSLHEGKLNSYLGGNIAALDFEPSGATEDEQSKAYEALNSSSGLIITGWRYWFKGPAGWGAGRTVEQFYRRVEAAPTRPEPTE